MSVKRKKSGVVALMGPPNVGKSSILNALVGQKIAATTHKPQTTRRQLRGIVTRGDVQVVFVDTPGLMQSAYELQKFMVRQAITALAEVDAIVFVSDTSPNAFTEHHDAFMQVTQAIGKHLRKSPPVLLVINKIDTLKDRTLLLPLMERWASLNTFSEIIPVSAHKKMGFEQFFATIDRYLPEREFIYQPQIFTDATEREIVGELIREKAMLELSQELPYRVAIQIEEFNESRRDSTKKPLVEIQAALIVERESQKKIAIGDGANRIKMIGMRARKEIEHLLGCQVMLKLFVRVEPKWSQSSKTLRKIGYQ